MKIIITMAIINDIFTYKKILALDKFKNSYSKILFILDAQTGIRTRDTLYTVRRIPSGRFYEFSPTSGTHPSFFARSISRCSFFPFPLAQRANPLRLFPSV